MLVGNGVLVASTNTAVTVGAYWRPERPRPLPAVPDCVRPPEEGRFGGMREKLELIRDKGSKVTCEDPVLLRGGVWTGGGAADGVGAVEAENSRNSKSSEGASVSVRE